MVIILNGLFVSAEDFMMAFNHPFVGTEHFFLAFLKKHKLKSISFNNFKEYVKKIIGYGTIASQNVLYTPTLRNIKNMFKNEYDAMVNILVDEDAIAHNILVCKKVDINSIIEEIRTLE